MADRPYTDAELTTAAEAISQLGIGSDEAEAAAVLDAVLPDHDARVRDDERARVVKEIARGFAAECRCTTPDPPCNAELLAAHIRGTYATPPTTEEPT